MTKLSWKSIRRYITVEPIILCWLFPSCILLIAMENLGLEKSCRVNLGLDDQVCNNMIDRSINDIDCSEDFIPLSNLTADIDFEIKILPNETESQDYRFFPDRETDDDTDDWGDDDDDDVKSPTALSQISEVKDEGTSSKEQKDDVTQKINLDAPDEENKPKEIIANRKVFGKELEILKAKVCKAETDSQKLVAIINGYRAPLAGIFPIIIILFAGGWSDKKGIRKPCMLLPLIGELLGCIALFISSIFMLQLPMEFGSVLEKLLPAMTGGITLMLMGVYSYLSEITTEDERTFRFGCLNVFTTIIPIVGIPFSGDLYNILGYFYLFLVCIVIYVIGIIYCIFGLQEIVKEKVTTTDDGNELKETKNSKEDVKNGLDNPTFEKPDTVDGSLQNINKNINSVTELTSAVEELVEPEVNKNFCKEFFDISLALGCIRIFTRKRENNIRAMLFLLAICYLLFIGPALGELDYVYTFTRLVFNWNGSVYSYYSTVSTVIVLVGTLLMVGVFSKFGKMSDAMVGIISTVLTIISKPIFALGKTSALFYVATVLDLFLGVRSIAVKSIVARFVENNELGRVFSVLGIMDAFAAFIFPPIYSAIYYFSVEEFPGAFFLFGEVFYVPTFIIFVILYFHVRKMPKVEDDETPNTNGTENESYTQSDERSTHM